MSRLHPKVAEAFQQIDAAIMNGDSFYNWQVIREAMDFFQAWSRRGCEIMLEMNDDRNDAALERERAK